MTSLETKFVDGLFWKTLAIGAAFAAAGWWAMSPHFAASVGLGVLVSAFNLRVVGWVSRKMIRAATDGQTSATVWSLILVIKLLLLFVLTWVFIVLVGADVFGYIIGYSTFLLAIIWQLVVHLGRPEAGDDAQRPVQDGNPESL